MTASVVVGRYKLGFFDNGRNGGLVSAAQEGNCNCKTFPKILIRMVEIEKNGFCQKSFSLANYSSTTIKENVVPCKVIQQC